MHGLFSWPDVEADRKWEFGFGAINGDAECVVWEKPRGFSFFYFLGMGAGGGGGGGAQGSTGHGGPGGGSGGFMSLLLPALMVPDRLFIKVGQGGAGATAGSNNAVDGTHTYFAVNDRFTSQGTYLIRAPGGTAASYGGGANSGGNAGSGGINGSTLDLYLAGLVTTWTGGAGRTGKQDSDGTQQTWSNGFLNYGGLAGAGTSNTTDYKGEGFTGPDTGFPPAAQDLLGGVAGGGNGDSGYFSWAPFFSTPGCGGGSLHNGVGGRGGDGGRGSGGGGGGQGTTGGIGGRGGDGVGLIVGL